VDALSATIEQLQSKVDSNTAEVARNAQQVHTVEILARTGNKVKSIRENETGKHTSLAGVRDMYRTRTNHSPRDPLREGKHFQPLVKKRPLYNDHNSKYKCTIYRHAQKGYVQNNRYDNRFNQIFEAPSKPHTGLTRETSERYFPLQNTPIRKLLPQ